MPVAEGQELQGHARPACSAICARTRRAWSSSSWPARSAPIFTVARSEDPRPGDDEDLRGLRREGEGRARRRRRFRLRRPHPALAGRPLRRRATFPLPDAVPDGERRAEDRLRDAARGRSEVRSAAAEVLRLADARRDDEPRGQRSRQHQRHAAAEPHAAADVRADADRRHRHDADDQLDADARHDRRRCRSASWSSPASRSARRSSS